jgi:hypothetical protein
MKKLLLASCGVVVAALACDPKLTANTVMVGTLLSTPAIDIPPKLLLANFDGGNPDAGSVIAELGDAGLRIPAQTAAFVFLGRRSGDSFDTNPPTPLDGAKVSLQPEGGTRVELDAQAQGTYGKTASSDSDAGFAYEPGKTYKFVANIEGFDHFGQIDSVPGPEEITQLKDPRGYLDHAANTSFSFTRPDPPAGQDRNLGFVLVYPVNKETGGVKQGQPTYRNVPPTPIDFIKLVALPGQWKQTQVTIPGSAFPVANANFAIIFQTVKVGGPQSDNLFTGSPLLAGTANVALVRTK